MIIGEEKKHEERKNERKGEEGEEKEKESVHEEKKKEILILTCACANHLDRQKTKTTITTQHKLQYIFVKIYNIHYKNYMFIV